MKSTLRSIVIFTSKVQKTQDLFIDILGLKLLHTSDTFVELTDAKDQIKIQLRQAPTLAHATHGFSPLLNFEIQNLDQACINAQQQYEAELDGPVVEDEYMKYACLKTSWGLTLAIH